MPHPYVERECVVCSMPYRAQAGNVQRGQRCCSVKCSWVLRKEKAERALPPLSPVNYEQIADAPRQTAGMEYPRVKLLNRSRHRDGWVDEHKAIAEVALGRRLPPEAQVHHVNGDKHDNRRTNLVICQDWAYHQLLHLRAKVLLAGGNPNTDKVCKKCGLAKPRAEFGRANRRGILRVRCRPCSAKPHLMENAA